MKSKKNYRMTDSAASELIGALVLISMIVLVVAVISAGLISRPSADKVPQIRFSVVNSTLVVNGATQTPYSISITHDGGDEINDGNYAVFIDGIRTTDFTVNPDPDKKWSVGRTITVNSSSAPGLVSVYYTGSNSPTLLGQRVLGTITTPQPGSTYTILATAGAYGIISPSGSIGVNYGENKVFTITPYTNYTIADVVVNGASVGRLPTYTFLAVTYDQAISATFAKSTYTITASSGPNGTVIPAGSSTVNYGETPTYTITPNAGYYVADVLVNGGSVGGVTTYTFSPVKSDQTISATFTTTNPLSIDALDPDYAVAGDPALVISILGTGFTPSSIGKWNGVARPTTYVAPDELTISISTSDLASAGTAYVTVVDGAATSNTAIFTIYANSYTITASAGTGGSISPTGTKTVSFGNDQSYTISQNTGYKVADVLVDGVSQGAITSYTFTNVMAAHTISASFVIDTFTITATSGANGMVTPAGVTTVNYGGSQPFTITPNIGYHTVDVLVDGVSKGTISSYTFTNVIGPHTISATFAVDTYIITASAGTGGTIFPNGATTVNYGDDQSYVITPNSGYYVMDVKVDGVSQGGVLNYLFTNIQASHTIAATFAPNTPLTITSLNPPFATAGDNSFTLTLTGTGYITSSVIKWNGVNRVTNYISPTMVSTTIYSSDIASAGTATVTVTNGVTTSNTITFEIYPRTCSITATSGANGAVTPAGVTTVNYGGSQSYTITPNTGYHIVDVKVDGISQGPVTSYTFMNVVSDRTISATFVINAYLITASAGTGGSISPGSVNVNYGSSQAFIITPNTGYSVSNVIVDGASKGAITGYTFTNVQASHIISATFLKWGAPTVTSIAPKSAKKGTTLSVTIKGTNFHTGAAVKFSTDTAGSSNVITLTNINVISSTQLTATVTLPNTGIVRYYVWVTNSDGQTGRSSKNIFRQKN